MIIFFFLASLLLCSHSFQLMTRFGFSSTRIVKDPSLYMGRGFGGGGGGFSSSSKREKILSKMEQVQDRQKAIAKISPDSSSMKLDSDAKTALSSVRNHIESVDVSYPGLEALHGDPPVLNMFRNAGIVWLTESYPNWSLMGIEMFDFTHSYAAKAISLFAMFLMAIALFDLLPELHKHIMKILNPVFDVAEKITGISRANFEEPQVVRYEMGQQFSWHYDTIPKSMQKASGNRRATLLIYLNSLSTSAGGATCFKDLNVQVKPDLGKALLFFPTYQDGENDERTLHCGQVAFDTKYIAQIWIHEKPYESDMR